jgi:predicted transcriptional regulator of viral defense system
MKNISFQSGNLLSKLNELEKTWFTLKEAQELLNASKAGTVRELVSDMVKRGLLMKVKAGVYYIIPYETSPDYYIPNWHLMAEPLAWNVGHYIGYYSALEIHGLITQPFMTEIIVTDTQVKPSVIKVKGISFQFIYHNTNHFFGSKKMWVNDFYKVNCSDLEKTFIDCFYKPEYAGGIVEVAKALYASKDKIDYERLLNYIQRFNAQSVIKRMGYILDLFGIATELQTSLLATKTKSWIALDSEMPKDGTYNSKWSILENIDKETILAAPTT